MKKRKLSHGFRGTFESKRAKYTKVLCRLVYRAVLRRYGAVLASYQRHHEENYKRRLFLLKEIGL